MRKPSFLQLVFAPMLLTVACGSTSSPSGAPTADASADAGASDGGSSGDSDAATADSSTGDAASHRSGFGEGIPPTTTTTTYAIKLGASTIVQPGAQAGYGITTNAGGTYRLVWAGGSTATEFWGSVWTTGHFTMVTPGCASICPLGAADFVSTAQTVTGGERIDFDAFPTTSLGGFDFVVDTEPVYFGLIVDGTRRPDSIFFPSAATGQISTPGIIPFALTPQ